MATARTRYTADVNFNVSTNHDVACMPGVPSTGYISRLQVKAFGTAVSIKAVSVNGAELLRGGLNLNIEAMDEMCKSWMSQRGMLE